MLYYPTATFSGTTTARQGYKLIDATGGFVSYPTTSNFLQNPPIGSIVVNTSSNPISQAFVTAVDNATTLSLSEDIMANGQNYVIYSGTNITDVERVNQQKNKLSVKFKLNCTNHAVSCIYIKWCIIKSTTWT